MAMDKEFTLNIDVPKFGKIMQQRIATRDNSSLVRKMLVEEICDDLANKVQIPKDILFGKKDEDKKDVKAYIPRGPYIAMNELDELDPSYKVEFLAKPMITPVFMPSIRNSKPNYGIYFTTIEDVKKRFQVCSDPESMKMIYRYRKGNIESRVEINTFDRLEMRMTADTDDIFRELAKGYDKAVIEEVFKMTQFDFNEKLSMLERKGCRVEIHDELFGCRQYVNVSVPFDLFRYLKIAPTETPTPANNPIPPIKDIKIQNNKVVVVYFEDGSFTKSICKDDETFNVYTGVMVCLFKRMLGKDDGQKKFTRLMEKAMGFFTRKEKALKKAKEEKKARIEAEKVKQNRNLRRKNKKREEQISIFAEALKRDRQAAAWENRPETSNEDI